MERVRFEIRSGAKSVGMKINWYPIDDPISEAEKILTPST
jgi:hypothetical protein